MSRTKGTSQLAASWIALDCCNVQTGMTTDLLNTTLSTDADLFREEAEQARRYARAMTDKSVIERLHEIAALYDALAAGQDPGPTDRD